MDRLKLNTTEELHREINTKMQQMLEETLARNLQLQKVTLYLGNKLLVIMMITMMIMMMK